MISRRPADISSSTVYDTGATDMGNVDTNSDNTTDSDMQLVNTYLLEALKAEGLDHIFLVPGGMIEPFMPNFSTAGIEAVVA